MPTLLPSPLPAGQQLSDNKIIFVSSGMVWTAPEILRLAKEQQGHGTQKGDVYSFAIICQEMLTRSGPFDMSYYHTEPKGTGELLFSKPNSVVCEVFSPAWPNGLASGRK